MIDGYNGAGLAIQAADHAVILCAEFDPGDILHANDPAVRHPRARRFAELLGRGQAALRENRIRKFLVLRRWVAADLAGRVDRILRLDRIDDIRHRDAELRKMVRLDP